MPCNVKPLPVLVLLALVGTIAFIVPVNSRAADLQPGYLSDAGGTLSLRVRLDSTPLGQTTR